MHTITTALATMVMALCVLLGAPAVAQASMQVTHIVKEGDTVSKLYEQFGISAKDRKSEAVWKSTLVNGEPIKDVNFILAGDSLTLMVSELSVAQQSATLPAEAQGSTGEAARIGGVAKPTPLSASDSSVETQVPAEVPPALVPPVVPSETVSSSERTIDRLASLFGNIIFWSLVALLAVTAVVSAMRIARKLKVTKPMAVKQSRAVSRANLKQSAGALQNQNTTLPTRPDRIAERHVKKVQAKKVKVAKQKSKPTTARVTAWLSSRIPRNLGAKPVKNPTPASEFAKANADARNWELPATPRANLRIVETTPANEVAKATKPSLHLVASSESVAESAPQFAHEEMRVVIVGDILAWEDAPDFELPVQVFYNEHEQFFDTLDGRRDTYSVAKLGAMIINRNRPAFSTKYGLVIDYGKVTRDMQNNPEKIFRLVPGKEPRAPSWFAKKAKKVKTEERNLVLA